MTDEPEDGAAHRSERPAHQRGLRPPWKPGESGNPTGRTRGYVLPAKRLQNLMGGEEGWAKVQARIMDVLEGRGEPGEATRLLGLVLGNDHALMRLDTDTGSEAAPPNVRLEKPDAQEEEKG